MREVLLEVSRVFFSTLTGVETPAAVKSGAQFLISRYHVNAISKRLRRNYCALGYVTKPRTPPKPISPEPSAPSGRRGRVWKSRSPKTEQSVLSRPIAIETSAQAWRDTRGKQGRDCRGARGNLWMERWRYGAALHANGRSNAPCATGD